MAVADLVISFIGVTAWPQRQSPARRFGHFRSVSSVNAPTISKPVQSTHKSTSISGLPDLSSVLAPPDATTPQPGRVHPANSYGDEHDLNTIADPRNRTASPLNSDDMPSLPQHPDLSDEVASLSTKLINAINHQTNLDDTLSATRMELNQAQDRIRELEAQNALQREMMAGDVWVRRKTVEAEKANLVAKVSEEKKSRQEVEQQKKKIEQELENLTAALFEEANKMVISAKEEARKEHEVMERKNEQLRTQLADTEILLRLQQEQLAELKQAMGQMTTEQDEPSAGTAPSSPGFGKFDEKDDATHRSDGIPSSGPIEPVSPSNPTSFIHILRPVLRTDLFAYEDFVSLIRTSKRLSHHSRPPSGTHTGLASLGIGQGHATAPSNGSASSLSTAGSTPVSQSSPQTPNTPASTVSSGSTGTPPHIPPLRESKFFKRVLAEDVEPTLRLDIAPGLSWLARRGVINAMTEGTLIVDPVPTDSRFSVPWKPQHYPCSLCGETRKDETYLRTHRFRTSESDSAQRHPLCRYCLSRVRSTCDFLGFLRIVKDGHWRADDEDAEKAAWEESVRLREQMFWARIGGGVIPAVSVQSGHDQTVVNAAPEKSARSSREEAVRMPDEMQGAGSSERQDDLAPETADEGIHRQDHALAPTDAPAEPPTLEQASEAKGASPETEKQDQTPSSKAPVTGKDDTKLLLLQIP